MLLELLEVEVKDSALDPDSADRTILWRNPESAQPLYRVFLYLDGRDLPFVSTVTYQLDPSFTPNTYTVTRSLANPRCKTEIWTWGLSRVAATILDRKGNTHLRYRDLEYDKEFRTEGVKFLAA